MPRFNYKCKDCGAVKDYITVPESCPACGCSIMTKSFSPPKTLVVDVEGGYEYKHGIRAWRTRVNEHEYAQILLGDKDPY